MHHLFKSTYCTSVGAIGPDSHPPPCCVCLRIRRTPEILAVHDVHIGTGSPKIHLEIGEIVLDFLRTQCAKARADSTFNTFIPQQMISWGADNAW